MSTLTYSRLILNDKLTCQGEPFERRDTPSDWRQGPEVTGVEITTNMFETGTSVKGPDSAQALHTLVDMALALEENSSRGTDHTYALKDRVRKLPTEDTDKVSSEKDHTYASNTIGFRYSNHRGSHAQPRKSASEENLIHKTCSAQETSARKCTSAEEIIFPEQCLTSHLSSDQGFSPRSSNSATLPRSKVKLFSPVCPVLCSQDDECVEPRFSSIYIAPKFRPKNSDNDITMEVPVKGDHTYAKDGIVTKPGTSKKVDQLTVFNILSSSAPGKMERVHIDRALHHGPSDHTYDKLSSAKNKDSQLEFGARIGKGIQKVMGDPSSDILETVYKAHPNAANPCFDSNDVHSSTSSCTSAMEWQPQDHGQSFEKRFLPMDHTYTTVA